MRSAKTIGIFQNGQQICKAHLHHFHCLFVSECITKYYSKIFQRGELTKLFQMVSSIFIINCEDNDVV